MLRSILKFLSLWVFPPGYIRILKLMKIFKNESSPIKKINTLSLDNRYDFRLNKEFYNIHTKSRLFILCNGPSILKENLIFLKDEICMSVSNFYKHENYGIIKPRYHALPNIFIDDLRKSHKDPESEVIRWLKEIDEKTHCSTIFLGSLQEKFVLENNLFNNKKVRFLKMDHPNYIPNNNSIEISDSISGVQSVSIMCLIIALYMGFKEIYLLGTDHDTLWSNRYDYFFDYKNLPVKVGYYNEDGTLNEPIINNLEATYFLWKQYIALKKIAEERNVSIINLSQGSFLDVFEKSKLVDTLLNV